MKQSTANTIVKVAGVTSQVATGIGAAGALAWFNGLMIGTTFKSQSIRKLYAPVAAVGGAAVGMYAGDEMRTRVEEYIGEMLSDHVKE